MLRQSYTALNESLNFPSGFPFCTCLGIYFVLFLSLVCLYHSWKVVFAHEPVSKGIKSSLSTPEHPVQREHSHVTKHPSQPSVTHLF